MKINFSELAKGKTATDAIVILPVGEDKKLSASGAALDKEANGAISKALATARFDAKRGKSISVILPGTVKSERVILIGAGDVAKLDRLGLEQLGGSVVPQLNQLGAQSATIVLDGIEGLSLPIEEAAAYMAHGAQLRSYTFNKYHTKFKEEEKPSLHTLTIALANAKAAEKPFAELQALAEGIFFTRDLVSEPPNIINPETMAEACLELKTLGVEVDILGEEEMYKLGMGALLGVGQGSAKESQLVVMRWNGLGKSSKAQPLAFVGKGVTFDSGGISIKPAAGMEDMKWDMGGAGVVVGLMKALAGRKAKVNVVGVAGLVENMPGGNAQRPGDVVTSYSGQTIEVINTDAEGRLVLADALHYVITHYQPKCIIDLATLTGAIIIALGTSRAGLFSNNDEMSEQLFATGKKTGEEVWRLPLADVYDKQINSDIADMQNIGKDREAGSITAAQFLQRFVGETPWVHLDIAGTAWAKKDSDLYPKGGTGWGVRLLNQWVMDYEERK